MIDEKKMEKEKGNSHTKTMRIHRRVYAELNRLKDVYAEKNERRNVSFSSFLLECCRIGEMLLTGQECYEASGKLYEEIEAARGEAIMESVRTGEPARPPVIMLRLGKDELPG